MNALWQMKFIRALLSNESFVVIYNKATSLHMKIYIKGSRQIIHEIIFQFQGKHSQLHYIYRYNMMGTFHITDILSYIVIIIFITISMK